MIILRKLWTNANRKRSILDAWDMTGIVTQTADLPRKAKEVAWDINHICTWKMMTG